MLKGIKRKEPGTAIRPFVIFAELMVFFTILYTISYPILYKYNFTSPIEKKIVLIITLVAVILAIASEVIPYLIYELDDHFQFLPSTKAEKAYEQKQIKRNNYIKKVKDENFAKIVCPYCANSSGDKFKTGTYLFTGDMFFVCRECGRSFFTEEQEALMEEQESLTEEQE